MLTDAEEKTLGRGLRAIFALIILSTDVIFHTWAFRCFWIWFFVPHGLPILNYPNIFGCALFVRMLTQSRAYRKTELPETVSRIMYPIFVTANALLMGFVAHWYM